VGQDKGHLCPAEQDFTEEEVLFREPPLVGALHAASRAAASACGHCFRHIGSVELQIARRILAAAAAEHDNQAQQEGHKDGHSGGTSALGRQTDENHSDCACASADARGGRAAALNGVGAVLLEGLLNGCERLPHGAQFPLPAVVPCPGGCRDEAYCSTACSGAAWDGFHQLLCTGPAAPRQPPAGLGHSVSAATNDEPRRKRSKQSAGVAHAHASAQHQACSSDSHTEAQRDGDCTDGAAEGAACRAEALREFNAHADATNDIFRVAARLVAGVLLRAAALLDTETAPSPAHASPAADVPSDRLADGAAQRRSPAVAAEAARHSGSAQHGGKRPAPEPGACWAALRRAWLPHAVAWKALWWEAVALPPDVSDEAAFRQGPCRRSSTDTLVPVTASVACGESAMPADGVAII